MLGARPFRQWYRDAELVAGVTAGEVRRQVPAFVDDEGVVLNGEVDAADAWNVLERGHGQLCQLAAAVVERRGSANWLWLLRRLRGQFHTNEWSTTDPYVQAVAEALAAGNSSVSTPLEVGLFAFEVDEHTIHDLYWLREVALLTYELQSTMKRCAKGQRTLFTPGDLPKSVPDPALDQLLRRFDGRVERSEANLLQAVGLATEIDDDDIVEAFREDGRLGGVVPMWWLSATARAPFLHLNDPPPTTIDFIDLDRIPPLRDQANLTADHVALIGLLWASLNFATRDPDRVQLRLAPAVQWGYMVMPHEQYLLPALDEIATWLNDHHGAAIHPDVLPADGAEILARLEALEPEVWPPMCGNPVHRAGTATLIDLIEFLFGVKAVLGPTSGARDGAVSFWARLVVSSGWVRE